MRRAAVLVLPLLLAACVGEQNACINRAREPLVTIEALIATTQGNLVRGYAIETQQKIVNVETVCEGTSSGGDPIYFNCIQPQTVEVEVPVAVDLNAEQAKLNSLMQRRRELTPQINDAVQACIAAYPE